MTAELVRVEAEVRRCALYRHFDAADVLLYVGITDTLEGRTSGHARTSDWVRFAVRAEADWYDSREEALAAEREAIQEEGPIFNRQHAVGDVDRRVMEYVHRREVEALRQTIAWYKKQTAQFLELVPDIAAKAEEKAQAEYEVWGQQKDDGWAACVLRYVVQEINGARNRAYDEGFEQAMGEMQKFLTERLRQTQEPPF